jgi:death-on-curing protein
VYHIAAGNISDKLLLPIMQCIVDCTDYSESLKLDIANAISSGEIGAEESDDNHRFTF